ncbi:acetyl-CoA carboxylase biotin carboxyl carrier protein subunit [bacterium]|nr:MAG: acetyl-CoA carboxylase biotin carboxyl carrier protein subunit [bacterium]
MRRIVDGDEIELSLAGATVSRSDGRLLVRHEGQTHTAAVAKNGAETLVWYRGHAFRVAEKSSRRAQSDESDGSLRAPMPGQIVDVLAAVGDAVVRGQRILVLEAMKTQQPLVAPFDGTVTEIGAAKGEQVDEGRVLARVEPA